MRLQAIFAAALAASTLSGAASAGTPAWGGQAARTAATTQVLVCLKSGHKQLILRGKRMTPGLLRPMTAREADKLAKSKRAVLLSSGSSVVWRGRVACLIGDNNVPIPDPKETPKPDTGAGTPPQGGAGGSTGGDTGGNPGDNDGDHGGDGDDEDGDNGSGNDGKDDEAPPPPPEIG